MFDYSGEVNFCQNPSYSLPLQAILLHGEVSGGYMHCPLYMSECVHVVYLRFCDICGQ